MLTVVFCTGSSSTWSGTLLLGMAWGTSGGGEERQRVAARRRQRTGSARCWAVSVSEEGALGSRMCIGVREGPGPLDGEAASLSPGWRQGPHARKLSPTDSGLRKIMSRLHKVCHGRAKSAAMLKPGSAAPVHPCRYHGVADGVIPTSCSCSTLDGSISPFPCRLLN